MTKSDMKPFITFAPKSATLGLPLATHNFECYTCGPTGGERKLEGRKVIGVTMPRELSSPLVLLISACIIIFHLIVSFLTSSDLISSYLIISHLVVPSALSSYSATTFSQLISFIISHPILSYLTSSYHSLLILVNNLCLSYLVLSSLISSYLISS